MLLNGAPPEGHERQCHARSRVTRERCRKWALTGREYCQFHGGRRSLAQSKGLPKHYTKHLGKTLKQKIEDLTEQSHHEQVQLYEELALMRIVAEQAVRLAEPVLMGDTKVDARTTMLAMSALGEALTGVKELVLAAAKIEKDAEDKVSVRVLDLFVLQILRAIYRACDDKEVAARIEQELQDTVALPAHNQNAAIPETDGTTLTPSDIVKEMDDTI